MEGRWEETIMEEGGPLRHRHHHPSERGWAELDGFERHNVGGRIEWMWGVEGEGLRVRQKA